MKKFAIQHVARMVAVPTKIFRSGQKNCLLEKLRERHFVMMQNPLIQLNMQYFHQISAVKILKI
jgi:hypothetical protein